MTQDIAQPVALREANQFDIGGPIVIDYSTTSINGKPRFSYRDADVSRQLSGDEITRVETAVGALVTIVLDTEPDNFVRTFTLVVPTIEGRSGSSTEFSTFGFETVIRQPLVPTAGVVQTHWVHQLSGVAQVLDF